VKVRTWQDVLGTNLRRLRLRKGLRQDDIASIARAVGFDWTQGTVAAIETGRRSVSWLEGELLQAVLGASLVELLATKEGVVDVGGTRFSRADLRRVERLMKRGPGPLPEGWAKSTRELGLRVTDEGLRPQRLIARRYGVSEDPLDITEMEAASFGTAERKAAERLGVSPLEVSIASFSLWGRSLTQERDRLFAKAPGEGDARVRRGHITRGLLRQLEVHVEPHAPRKSSRKRSNVRPKRPPVEGLSRRGSAPGRER
jgi:Helix-turn-helix domain